MNHKTLACSAALVLGTAGALPEVANAENGHSYNGASCTAYYGSQKTLFDSYTTGIRNATNAARWVNCPVIVDEIARTTGTTRTWIHVTGKGSFRCYLISRNGNSGPRQSKSGARTNTGWLNIPALTTDDYWGSYSLYCQIPAYGLINTIWIGEKD